MLYFKTEGQRLRIFKTRQFRRWAVKEGLSDKLLTAAVQEISDGLFDADLGSGVYKKRVAIRGRGKRGGVRTLLAFKKDSCAFYLYGFAKNRRSNISVRELRALKYSAKVFLGLSDEGLNKVIKSEALIEVSNDE